MANLALLPFGREAVQTERSGGCLYIIMNIIWLLFAGIELAICHLILALIFAIKIVGIPYYCTASEIGIPGTGTFWHGYS